MLMPLVVRRLFNQKLVSYFWKKLKSFWKSDHQRNKERISSGKSTIFNNSCSTKTIYHHSLIRFGNKIDPIGGVGGIELCPLAVLVILVIIATVDKLFILCDHSVQNK